MQGLWKPPCKLQWRTQASAEAGQRVRQGIQRTEPGKAGARLVYSSTPLTPVWLKGHPRSHPFGVPLTLSPGSQDDAELEILYVVHPSLSRKPFEGWCGLPFCFIETLAH